MLRFGLYVICRNRCLLLFQCMSMHRKGDFTTRRPTWKPVIARISSSGPQRSVLRSSVLKMAPGKLHLASQKKKRGAEFSSFGFLKTMSLGCRRITRFSSLVVFKFTYKDLLYSVQGAQPEYCCSGGTSAHLSGGARRRGVPLACKWNANSSKSGQVTSGFGFPFFNRVPTQNFLPWWQN